MRGLVTAWMSPMSCLPIHWACYSQEARRWDSGSSVTHRGHRVCSSGLAGSRSLLQPSRASKDPEDTGSCPDPQGEGQAGGHPVSWLLPAEPMCFYMWLSVPPYSVETSHLHVTPVPGPTTHCRTTWPHRFPVPKLHPGWLVGHLPQAGPGLWGKRE